MVLGALCKVASDAPKRWLHAAPLRDVKQLDEVKLASSLCMFSYLTPKDRPQYGTLELDKEFNHTRQAVYVDKSGAGKVHVAFRGTTDAEDYWVDMKMAADCPWETLHQHDRYHEAIILVKKVADKYPCSSIFVHGHSLGGTQAMVVAINMADEIAGGCLFNPGSGTDGLTEVLAIGAIGVVALAGVATAAVASSSAVAVGCIAAASAQYNRVTPPSLRNKIKAYHMHGDILSTTFPYRELVTNCTFDMLTVILPGQRHSVANFAQKEVVEYCASNIASDCSDMITQSATRPSQYASLPICPPSILHFIMVGAL